MPRRPKTFARPVTLRTRVREAGIAVARTGVYRFCACMVRCVYWVLSRVLRVLEWFFSLPPIGAAVAVTGVVAGFWASLYTNEIKGSLPIHPLDVRHYLHLRGSAGLFWLMLAIFGFGFIAQQWAQSRGARRAQKNLIDKSTELEDMIRNMRSLPPHKFLVEFQDLHGKAYPLGLLAFAETKKEVLEAAICNVLECVALLASNFDREPGHHIFSANVMIYRDQEWLRTCNGADRDMIENHLMFAEDLPRPRTQHLRGVLVLLPVLAVSINARHNKPTRAMVPTMALPVPLHDLVQLEPGKTLSRVLPGAPWAVVNLRYTSFSSINEMMVAFDTTCDFTEGTRNQVVEYFHGARDEIRSFLSIPLEVPGTSATIGATATEPPEQGQQGATDIQGQAGGARGAIASPENAAGIVSGRCIGVLNIHCSREGMLNTDGTKLFMPLMEPFIRVLVQLIGKYSRMS